MLADGVCHIRMLLLAAQARLVRKHASRSGANVEACTHAHETQSSFTQAKPHLLRTVRYYIQHTHAAGMRSARARAMYAVACGLTPAPRQALCTVIGRDEYETYVLHS